MIIEGQTVILRPFKQKDVKNLTMLLKKNRAYWSKSEPLRDDLFYTVKFQRQYIRSCMAAMEKGTSYTFGIFLKESGRLIGEINLYQIRRAPFYSACTGYSIDKDENGKGYATESLKLIVGFAFNQLALHRITAEAMPRNIASIRVLEKTGFQKEGLARENISINGVWEDHLQYGILKREWRKGIRD